MHQIRTFEVRAFDHHFDYFFPSSEKLDLDEAYREDVSYDLYLGQRERRRYTSRPEFKRSRFHDTEQVTELVRQYLAAGLIIFGHEFLDTAGMDELARRCGFRVESPWTPFGVWRVLNFVRLILAADPHVLLPGTVGLIPLSQPVPYVRATTVINNTVLKLYNLSVRRTFDVIQLDLGKGFPNADLTLRPDRYDVSLLQRHARMLFNLLGIWMCGEPYPTPPVDDGTVRLAEQLSGLPSDWPVGRLIGTMVMGCGIFESLHEFAHVISGDWLRPPGTLAPEDEMRADRFAALCLLNDEAAPLRKIYGLRGAHLFLGLLGLAEHYYGAGTRHPGARARAKRLYDIIRANLDPGELMIFDSLDEVEALCAFCYVPSKYGAAPGDRFGG